MSLSGSERPSSEQPPPQDLGTGGVDLTAVVCDTLVPPQKLPFHDDDELTFGAVLEFLSDGVFLPGSEKLQFADSKSPTLPPAALGSGDQEKFEALLREFESGDE